MNSIITVQNSPECVTALAFVPGADFVATVGRCSARFISVILILFQSIKAPDPMFNLFGWIPQTIRNHPVITWIVWSAALATVSTIITSEVLNNTTLAEMKGRNDGLNSEIAHLREENRTAQSRYDAAQASREETISKRVAELSAGYREHIKSLDERNEKLQLENADLKSTLSAE